MTGFKIQGHKGRWDNTDPFGVLQPNTNPAALGNFAYNPRFPGQVYDSETGLNYNYHRTYDAAIGSYTSSDPIGLAGGWNTYSFVGGNPVNRIDPKGLCPWCWAYVIAAWELWELQDSAIEGIPGGSLCKSGTTSLYRAVKPDELEDILKTGQFINRGSAEGKYFTSSAEHASDYAEQAVRAFQDPPYTIIKTDIPTSSLPPPTIVDGGIPAYVIPNNVLPGMSPQPMTSMPIPR